MIFLGVLMQDNGGNSATVRDAAGYAAQHHWNFPAAADTLESMWRYVTMSAVPFYMAIRARDMKILQSFSGGFSSQNDRRSFVQQYLDAVQ